MFSSIEEYDLAVDDMDLDVDEDTVLVLQNAGPRGYPGMPEVGNMTIPRKLAEQGVDDMVRISDARMSGTAYGTVVLHVAPEAAVGGPLALVRTGDWIELDVPARTPASRCLRGGAGEAASGLAAGDGAVGSRLGEALRRPRHAGQRGLRPGLPGRPQRLSRRPAEPLMSDPWGPFEAIRGLRPDGVLPQVTPVRRLLHDVPTEADPYAAAQAALAPLASAIQPGARIAVTAGSRGIHDLVIVVKAAVDWLRSVGAEPFVVPAMGSHGGATADGQREMLAGLGVTSESVGCPIEATMETVVLGNLPDGTPVHHDALAAKADGVLLVNRVKPHTDFHGPVESGLGKILAIGLGNHRGAAALHAGGIPALGGAIEAAARMVVASGKILGGLAILENAYEKTAAVELVVADGIAGARRTRCSSGPVG